MSTFSTASPQAEAITELAWTSIWILSGIALVVFGLISYIVVRFRDRGDGTVPRPVHGNNRLEITWTAIPLLIVIVLFVLNLNAMYESNPEPAEGHAPDVEVTGRQWWWEVRYPGAGVVTANEVHVPVGRKLLVRLRSADVIHSFWVPELGPKMDVVPHMPTHVWLEPRLAGVFEGACAEFCGNSHAWMRLKVVAHPPEEYEAWLRAEQAAPPPPSTESQKEGEKLFLEQACLNCHASRGMQGHLDVAPDLTWISRRSTLGAGVLPNSRENLAAWLKDPQKYKPGCNMPDFDLDDREARALTDYLWRTP